MNDSELSPHFDPAALRARAIRERVGFVNAAETALLAQHADSRLWPLLVRCGGCRFTASAQDVAHLIKCIEAGGDYVRDVSFPAAAGGR